MSRELICMLTEFPFNLIIEGSFKSPQFKIMYIYINGIAFRNSPHLLICFTSISSPYSPSWGSAPLLSI